MRFCTFCFAVEVGLLSIFYCPATFGQGVNYFSFVNKSQTFLTPAFSENPISAENSVFKSKVDDISERFRDSLVGIKSKTKRIDVVFLIDSSNSVGKLNFQSEIRFIKKLLSDFNVSYNYTRVALVTFSSQAKVIRHLDQISDPSEDNDKCKLLNDDIPKLRFVGGGTFTYGALKEAREIFAGSNRNGKKFVFLVTDGFSNGISPISIASKLKDENVTIFTIGIQSGNAVELLNISSAPKEKYSFFLDSFFEFEGLARRALRMDYKVGERIKIKNETRCNGLCDDLERNSAEESQSCCDENADCNCGTSSGHYACVCHPGFYGSGLNGQCFPCPNGTYWHNSNMCRPCPDINHITIEQPALGIEQCVCKAGFRKADLNRCEGITCSKLSPPENGYFVKQQGTCLNVLNAACGARCQFGFQLIGTSLRLCLENGTWSGIETHCVLKTCPSLSVPYYGSIVCRNRDLNLFFDYSPRNATFMETYEDDVKRVTEPMPIDTECTYKCGPGYYLVGSRVRNCLPLSKWDGLHTTCKQVVCPPLPELRYGEYEFDDCSRMKNGFGTNCTISCPKGFTLKGPVTKTCGGRKVGVWSHKNKQQKCVDITPPTIICPENLNITADAIGEFVLLKEIPPPLNVSDSSGKTVSVWLTPAFNKTEGIKLPIGHHTFTYTASDLFSNTAECDFIVNVIDTIPPTVENCVDPDEFLVSLHPNATHLERTVEWEEPIFHDNSNLNLRITKTLEPGYLSPGKYQTKYTAWDLSNNSNSCLLNITVKELTCNPLSSSRNGQTFCARNITHTWCEVTCNMGYAIFDEEGDTYLDSLKLTCLNNAPLWKYDVIPDCTMVELPNSIEQLLTLSLDSEDAFCSNSDSQDKLQNALADHMRSHLCNDLESCEVLSKIPECIHESVNDTSKHFYNIVKRDTREGQPKEARSRIRSNVRIKLYTRIGKRLGIWKKNQLLSDNVRRVKQELQTLNTNEQLKMILNEMKIDVRKLKVDEQVKCPDGSISRKYLCVQCPSGTYQDEAFNRCQLCPIGTYNSEIGQINCTPCPTRHLTRKTGSTQANECKHLCPPGTMSKTRPQRRRVRTGVVHPRSLMPFCRKCQPGYYQPHYDAPSCLPCAAGYTSQRGSTECISQESHACQSELMVCGPFGYCIPHQTGSHLYRCICAEGYMGTHCEMRVDLCVSAPCYNNGICHYVNHTTTVCECAPQFTGRFCEELKESCERTTCRNGGTCVETEERAICECPYGYTGDLCDEQVDFCSSSPCDAGICINRRDGYECLCPAGMIGKRCHLRPCDYLPCHKRSFCIDLAHYPATRDSYSCVCPRGLRGYACDQVDSPCDVLPCKNNGHCVPLALRIPGNVTSFYESDLDEDSYGKYTCKCPPYFYGKHCEVLTTPDFVMNFPDASTSNYVELKGPKTNLKEISFCAWIQTNDDFNYGSLISYATEDNDNTFTFTDCSGFVLYVNGNHTVTDTVVNDGNWHFICVAWTSEQGFYEVYLDGQLQRTGFNVSAEREIPANGIFIIGQEQDQLGGHFSESEAFIGNLSYFDIWDNYISGSMVQEYYTTCEPYQGSLYSWTDFKPQIRGKITVKSSEFCRACPKILAVSNGIVQIRENNAFYRCNPGFVLRGNPVRYCLRTSQWSLESPFCEIVDCGEPSSVENGYYRYTYTTYRGEVVFQCNNGFALTGDQKRICKDDGNWSGQQPKCISKIKCNSLEVQQPMRVFYANDKGYLSQNLREFPVGAFAEVTCVIGDRHFLVALLTCLDDGQWDGFAPENCENFYTTPSPVTWSPYTAHTYTPELIKATQKIHQEQSTITSTPFVTITSPEETTEAIPTSIPPTPLSSTQTSTPQIASSTVPSVPSFLTGTASSTDHRIITEKHLSTNAEVTTSSPTTSTSPSQIIPDNDFWENLKSYLFSGCSVGAKQQSSFCDYHRGGNAPSDLSDYEPPMSNDFHDMDVKLLNLLKKHANLIISREVVPFETLLDLIMYGQDEPKERLSSQMEKSLRFVFCIYIDTILWDDKLRLSEEEADSSENITKKLKLLILKISIPVFREFEERRMVSSTTQITHEKECNLQLAPELPPNGVVVGVLSLKNMEHFEADKIRDKPNFVPMGSSILYACALEFRVEGDTLSECDAEGKWTPLNYSCEFTGCSSPPKPTNMYFEEGTARESYKIGEKLNLRCIEGFVIHGQPMMQCLATRKWTKVFARCAKISCNKPKIPEDAEIIKGRSYLFEDKVTIECGDEEEVELTCQSNGSWHPSKIC